MRWLRPSGPALCLAVTALAAGATPAFGTDADGSRTVGGFTVYLGVLPAELVLGHPKGHAEEAMHGGVPSRRHVHHVLIAVFDTRTGERVGDLRLEAQVSELGLAGTRKPLEPMTIADTVTYGNYFHMPATGPYRIAVDIYRPGGQRPLRAEFTYEHRYR